MKKSGSLSVCKCDVCSTSIYEPNGYVLPTNLIVPNIQFWEKQVTSLATKGLLLPNESFDIFRYVVALAGQKSGWIVCKRCARMYQFDREESSNLAKKWWIDRNQIYFGPLCSLSEDRKTLHYDDKESFDKAYSFAKEALLQYRSRHLQQYISTHKPDVNNSRTALQLLNLLFNSAEDFTAQG